MKKFKHSGTFGDMIQSLALMKHFGGGEFYLHLDQISFLVKFYYGREAEPIYKGKMNIEDFEFIKEFLESQSYISKVDILDPLSTEITHNLDKFRSLFVHHPANYITTYCMAFGIHDKDMQNMISQGPWLTCPNSYINEEKPFIVNRTSRYVQDTCHPQWKLWKEQGLDEQSLFVGLEEEYENFKNLTQWNIEYKPTKTMLELAQVIAGSKMFIGNQSVALSIAQGLGVNYTFEARTDLPIERNENFYNNHSNGNYFLFNDIKNCNK